MPDSIGDGREILASGSFVTSGPNDQITFRAADVTFEFAFATNVLAAPNVVTNLISRQRCTVRFTNFNSSLGTAWGGILGNINGQPLYLAAAVYSMGDPVAQRVVHYTLSLQR